MNAFLCLKFIVRRVTPVGVSIIVPQNCVALHESDRHEQTDMTDGARSVP